MRGLQWIVAGLAVCLVGGPAVSAEYEVAQKGKQFTVKNLKIRRGDVVSFVNRDSYFHNVYSMSVAKTFDLGSYAKGDSRKVKFDSQGKVEVECAIHPHMKMLIEVTE